VYASHFIARALTHALLHAHTYTLSNTTPHVWRVCVDTEWRMMSRPRSPSTPAARHHMWHQRPSSVTARSPAVWTCTPLASCCGRCTLECGHMGACIVLAAVCVCALRASMKSTHACARVCVSSVSPPHPCCQLPSACHCARPDRSMKQQQIVEEVVMRGLRPRFPSGTPRGYAELAQACWSGAATSRPSFEEVGSSACTCAYMSVLCLGRCVRACIRACLSRWAMHHSEQTGGGARA